jgi:hypothetical protein
MKHLVACRQAPFGLEELFVGITFKRNRLLSHRLEERNRFTQNVHFDHRVVVVAGQHRIDRHRSTNKIKLDCQVSTKDRAVLSYSQGMDYSLLDLKLEKLGRDCPLPAPESRHVSIRKRPTVSLVVVYWTESPLGNRKSNIYRNCTAVHA